MIKKTILCLIAIMMIISVTACGSSSSVPVSDAEYSDHVGCQFSGTDPWGGSLSITIRTIVDGKMEWTFTDSFDDHTLYQEIKGTDIREGTAEFDLNGKDVEHKDVSFAYQGTLQLNNDQMIITLESGAVKTNSPEGSSLTRVAEALTESGQSNQITLTKPDIDSLVTYKVQSGDSLHSIAEKYGITTKELVIANQTVIMETARAHGYEFDDVTEYAKYLYPGEVLIIPGN